MDLNQINTTYKSVKESTLFGRYITNNHIEKCFKKCSKTTVSTLGLSVENRPIYGITYGKGKTKVLLWSQMHGNESTTTKALFDCFNLFETENALTKKILNQCTVFVIPILNPDGAESYTRLNANKVDLNRDAQDLTQPESKLLRQVYDNFKPDYCFNLHGQRTIYSVADTNVSATLSFLAPSQDIDCTLTPNRKVAMSIIAEINTALQNEIPNGISRYDDAFNLNCVGDTFQSFGVPTLLFEAGHYRNDYDREEVRRFVFMSILKGLEVISKVHDDSFYKAYFKIPENKKLFCDIIIRNAKLNNVSDKSIDIVIQYKEVLLNDSIDFVPIIESISNLDALYGHKEINAKNEIVKNSQNLTLEVTNETDFVMINNEKTSLKR